MRWGRRQKTTLFAAGNAARSEKIARDLFPSTQRAGSGGNDGVAAGSGAAAGVAASAGAAGNGAASIAPVASVAGPGSSGFPAPSSCGTAGTSVLFTSVE